MQSNDITVLLNDVLNHKISVEKAKTQLINSDFADLDFAKIDLTREQRTGYPEVIYGSGKTAKELIEIIKTMLDRHLPVLATRVDSDKAKVVLQHFNHLTYHERAQIIATKLPQSEHLVGNIAIVTAGTSDLKVAEEAAITAKIFGNQVNRIYDVGVAGIHRLFAHLSEIRESQVIIVIAGMEGALASVVGGLVDKPVIAVPTSIGYGTNFGGMTALLTMLNSCASGITVTNIDNGFGAAYSASMINKMGALNENTVS